MLLIVSSVGAMAAEVTARQPELQSLLRRGDFDALEQLLAEAENAYEAGQITDDVVDYTYAAFSSADPALEAKLSQWIAANPDSHQPRLARGVFYYNLGWMFRGSAYFNRTARERIDLMVDHFDRATQDMEAALERKPSSGLTYSYLINMSMAAGRREEMVALLNAGLAADPRSFTIRRRYLASLTPWWGGGASARESLQKRLVGRLFGNQDQQYPVAVPESLLGYISEVETAAAEMPELQPLVGYVDYVVAAMLTREGRRQEAARFFNRAIEHGDWWYYRLFEGNNFRRMKNYDAAITSYDRALELRPDNQSVLEARAKTYRYMDKLDLAFRDLDEALALTPKDPDLILEKSYGLWAVERYDEAVAVLDDAFHYGEFNADVWGARGRLYLYKLDDPALALGDLKRTTELDPTDQRHWYNYAGALYAVRDCEAVQAYKKYLEVCPRYGNRCDGRAQKFAREAIEFLDNPQICPS